MTKIWKAKWKLKSLQFLKQARKEVLNWFQMSRFIILSDVIFKKSVRLVDRLAELSCWLTVIVIRNELGNQSSNSWQDLRNKWILISTTMDK